MRGRCGRLAGGWRQVGRKMTARVSRRSGHPPGARWGASGRGRPPR